MPKKFDGENSKAAVAKARKTAAKEAEQAKKQQQAEDEYWKDDDKKVAKKQQRKEDQEKKKTEQLAKKAALKTLAEEELASIKVEPKQQSSKITRLQIEAEMKKREEAARKASTTASSKVVPATREDEPIPENINRVAVEGEEARSVEEAIKVLSVSESSADIDRHPERRMKAAYAAFEERRLAQLRNENPNMRLSQIKQMLHREWLKSPENPLNSPSAGKFNVKAA